MSVSLIGSLIGHFPSCRGGVVISGYKPISVKQVTSSLLLGRDGRAVWSGSVEKSLSSPALLIGLETCARSRLVEHGWRLILLSMKIKPKQ